MAICIESEDLLSLPQAAAEIKPRRKHVSTLHRWRLKGVRGIKLETVMVGGHRCTSAQAIERFHQRVTAAADGQPFESRSSTPRQRKAEVDQAERDLDQMNVRSA